MKHTVVKRVLGILIIAVFIALTVWYVTSNWNEFASLSITDPLLLLPAALLLLINIYGSGILIDLTIEPHGVKLTKNEAFGLANVTRFINQIAPTYVAATVRAAYMKRVHRVSYTSFSSSFVISNLLQFFISGLLTVITFFLLVPGAGDTQPLVVVGIGSLVFLVTLLIPSSFFLRINRALLGGAKSNKIKKLFKRIEALLEAYEVVRKYPKLLPKTIAWMLITTLAVGAVYYLLYLTLGFQVSPIEALFIAALSGWSILFAITPGSLGVREGLMVAGAQIAGVSIPTTLLVAVLLRLLMLVVPGIFSAFYMPRFVKSSKKN